MSVAYGDGDFAGLPADFGTDLSPLGVDLDSRAGGDDATAVRITRWRDLPTEERPAAWNELREFVQWLVGRYALASNVVPPCWFLHPALVEELSALRAAWEASFDVDTDGGLGPIGWHERFAVARERIVKYAYKGECARGTHMDTATVTLTVDEGEWERWIAR